MNTERFAKVVLDWWGSHMTIAGYSDYLIVSNRYTMFRCKASDLLFTAMRLRELPPDGETWQYRNGTRDEVKPNSICDLWIKLETTLMQPLTLTPWIYDFAVGHTSTLRTRIFTLPDSNTVYVNERFMNLLLSDYVDDENGFSELGKLDYFGTSPTDAIVVRQKKQMIAAIMPLNRMPWMAVRVPEGGS